MLTWHEILTDYLGFHPPVNQADYVGLSAGEARRVEDLRIDRDFWRALAAASGVINAVLLARLLFLRQAGWAGPDLRSKGRGKAPLTGGRGGVIVDGGHCFSGAFWLAGQAPLSFYPLAPAGATARSDCFSSEPTVGEFSTAALKIFLRRLSRR